MYDTKHSQTPAVAPTQQPLAEAPSDQKTSFTGAGQVPAVAPVDKPDDRQSASDLAYSDEEQEGAGSADHASSPRLRVTASRLNVRTSPTARSRQNIIGKLERDDEVVPVDRDGRWVLITYNAQPAFVHGGYLGDASEKTSEPEIAPVRKPVPVEPAGDVSPGSGSATEAQGPAAVEAHAQVKQADTDATNAASTPEVKSAPPQAAPAPAKPADVAGAQQATKAEPKPDAAKQPRNDHANLPALQGEYRKIVQLFTDDKLEKSAAMSRFVAFDKALHGGTTSLDGAVMYAALWGQLLVMSLFAADKKAKEQRPAQPPTPAPAAGPEAPAVTPGAPAPAVPSAKFDGSEGPLVEELHALELAEADRIASMLVAIDDKAAALGKKTNLNEERGPDRAKMVAHVADLRAALTRLELPGMDKVQVAALKARIYRHLHDLAPYYSQGRNVDVVEEFKESQTTRTCNITSLAMAFETIGVSASSYNKMAVARRVAGYFMNEQEKAAAIGESAGTGDLSALRKAGGIEKLRLPDFLELACVAEHCTASSSDQEVNAARWEAWNKITRWSFLQQLATAFGVPRKVHNLKTGAGAKIGNELKSWGGEKTPGKSTRRKDMEAYSSARHMVEELEAEGKTDTKQYAKWKKKLESANTSGVQASLTGADAPIELEDYKSSVTSQVGSAVDAGQSIVVGLSGHYVRFQGFTPDGVIVDDPGRWDSGANRQITWAEARAMGYFHHWMTLG